MTLEQLLALGLTQEKAEQVLAEQKAELEKAEQAKQAEIEAIKSNRDEILNEKKALQDKQNAEKSEKEKLEQEKARAKGDFEAIENQYKDKIASLEQEIVRRDKQRDTDIVQTTALKLASSLSDNPNNQEVLQMLIEKRLVAENGQVKITDSSGNLTIASLDDFAKEIKTSGKYDALITGTKASGTGASGQSGTGTKQASDYTEQERVELASKNPQLFTQLFTQKE